MKQQYELNFDAGLTDQFATFGDALRASVYGCGKLFKNIAADLDLSPSMLSRMLSDDPTVSFPAYRLDELMESTGDEMPVYWLVEKLCMDAESRQKQALAQVETLLPRLTAAVEKMGDAP